MLSYDYWPHIQRGIDDGTLQRVDGEVSSLGSKDLLLQTFRARAAGLKRRDAKYAGRLGREVIALLCRMEMTPDREIELVRFEEVGTRKSYLVYTAKPSQEILGVLYVEAAPQTE
jgi:hypothetical protein